MRYLHLPREAIDSLPMDWITEILDLMSAEYKVRRDDTMDED